MTPRADLTVSTPSTGKVMNKKRNSAPGRLQNLESIRESKRQSRGSSSREDSDSDCSWSSDEDNDVFIEEPTRRTSQPRIPMIKNLLLDTNESVRTLGQPRSRTVTMSGFASPA